MLFRSRQREGGNNTPRPENRQSETRPAPQAPPPAQSQQQAGPRRGPAPQREQAPRADGQQNRTYGVPARPQQYDNRAGNQYDNRYQGRAVPRTTPLPRYGPNNRYSAVPYRYSNAPYLYNRYSSAPYRYSSYYRPFDISPFYRPYYTFRSRGWLGFGIS